MNQKKVDLSTFTNTSYQPGSPLKRVLWYYTSLIFFKSGWLPIYSLKRFLLKLFGAQIGSNVVIKPHVTIKYPWKLSIGKNTWIGEYSWIDNLQEVEIGSDCCISQGALLLCGNHDFKKTTFDLLASPIRLEDGVWIGAKSVVSGGVTCKSHSVLSIHSATSKDLEAYKIYRGNPAEFIKERIVQ